MIVSRGRGYCFVHIPKTGGTSMALALEDRAMADDILVGDTPKALKRKRRLTGVKTRGRLWKHSTVADAEGLLTEGDLERLFFFTLVRNPWDRMVSYYHWLREQEFGHPAVGLARRLDFEGFVLDPLTAQSFKAFPSRHYLTDSEGVDRSSLYVRLEHLKEDLAPLEEHLGFSLELPKANTSDRDPDYSSAYTAESRDRIAEICAADIDAFGYKYD